MVTCALCKDRLADALEDEGSFRVAEGFKNVDGQPGIAHTCLRCGKRLLEATTAAAIAIMRHDELDFLHARAAAAEELLEAVLADAEKRSQYINAISPSIMGRISAHLRK